MFIKQPNLRWFQCVNDDNLNKCYISSKNYVSYGEPYNKDLQGSGNLSFVFFDRTYDVAIWCSQPDFHVLCQLARKYITQLEQAALQSSTSYCLTDYSVIRKKICEFCLSCRSVITSTAGLYAEIRNSLRSTIKPLLLNIKSLKQLPDYVLLNSCNIENLHQHASYNNLHLSLDLIWICVSSVYYIDYDIDKFEHIINLVLKDLIYVSMKKIEKTNNYTDLSTYSPFLCSCFKELWLLIQFQIEDLKDKNVCKDFWYYFNEAVKQEMNLQASTNHKNYVTCVWIVHHVTKLQALDTDGSYIGPEHHRVKSNFPLMEQCLKYSTNVNDEQLMCSCLMLLAPLQLTWWTKDANFDLLQILWEYFYKKIDQSFSNEYGTFVSQKSYNYSLLTESILDYNCKYQNGITSYDVFLSLLGNFLNKNPCHWSKFKGRIYSKLSPSKLGMLTDIGLNNLIQLFFVLAYTVNFKELTDKLQSLLNQLPSAKSEKSTVVWSAYISILFMRVNRQIILKGLGSESTCTPILLAVQSASSDRSQEYLMKIYVEGLKSIIDSDNDLKCQEYILFEGWINRYLQWCSHTDACYLFDILKNLITKIKNVNASSEWWAIFETNIIPAIMQLSSGMDSPGEITDLAATIILVDSNRFKNLLEHFTSDIVSVGLVLKFLKSILGEECLNLSIENQNLLLQAWIRIAVLICDVADLTEVTSQICKLPVWSNLRCDTIDYANPLLPVIRKAGSKFRNSKSIQQTAEMKKWFETYFGKLDRWISPIILGTEQKENSSLILRIYVIGACLYMNCSPAIYTKNKNTCLLYRLTTVLLLPSTVLTNKKISEVIHMALEKTWHVFFTGLTRLDYKNDLYITRTLKDMIVRYIPYMNNASSPIIRCLDDEFDDDVTAFVIDTIATKIISCKTKHFHEHSIPTLAIILAMSKRRNVSKSKFIMLTTIIFTPLCEQLLFNDDNNVKNIGRNLMQSIISHEYYNEIRESLKTLLLNTVDNHLSFHAPTVFRLLEFLAEFMSRELAEMFDAIENIVKKVECMRGVAFDKSLRKGLQKLQQVIS